MNSVRVRLTGFVSRHPAIGTVLRWLNLNNPGGSVNP
jgi:hypothetical protein